MKLKTESLLLKRSWRYGGGGGGWGSWRYGIYCGTWLKSKQLRTMILTKQSKKGTWRTNSVRFHEWLLWVGSLYNLEIGTLFSGRCLEKRL